MRIYHTKEGIVLNVIKRDGRVVNFNPDKIENAMIKAYKSCHGKAPDDKFNLLIDRTVSYIERQVLLSDDGVGVEDIQDLVERKLMDSRYKEVARSYISYRDSRSRERLKKSKLIQDMASKLKGTNIENQNANVDENSFGGRMGEARSVVVKDYALNYCMSAMSRENHLNNMVYIHDLDSYAPGMSNCLSLPLDDLLRKGFTTRQTDVRPANSVNTAFQLVAVTFQLQSLNQFGGVAATHLDHTMVPYVRKSFYKHFKDGLKYVENYAGDIKDLGISKRTSIVDKKYKNFSKAYSYAYEMTERETYQAVEGMYHNLRVFG